MLLPQTYRLAAGEGYTISGELTQTNANEQGFPITVSLSDKENTRWADTENDTADKVYRFVIHKAAVVITAADKCAYVNNTAPDLSKPELDRDYTVAGLIGTDTLITAPRLTYDPAKPDMTKTGSTTKIVASGADAGDNYTIAYVDGTLTIACHVSSGSTGTETTTTTNPDGSTTKTETKADGTVTETTTNKDGSTTKTETRKDGSSVTASKTADGSTGTVKTDKDGRTEADAEITEKAVEDAKKSGETVKVPAVVKVGEDSGSAPTVKVVLPKNAGDTALEIPASGVNAGTVAVLVHPDGTEEIIKDSVPAKNGVRFTADGSVTVKIVNNAKDFIDTRNHWAKDYVDFVSARELMNGISAAEFGPNMCTTRGMLMTVLARYDGQDTTAGTPWYQNGVDWAKANNVSDGTAPTANITREQLVTMLYRYAGSPAASGSLDSFSDAASVSAYALSAMRWAVGNGIVNGCNGRLNPKNDAARAEVAAILMRFCENVK